MSQSELKLVWVNEALLTSPKTKREREEQATQAARSASWSAWTPLLSVLATGFGAIAISVTLFGFLWIRLANVENSVSKLSGQLEPIFKKYYKEIAAASGITATEVEAIQLTKATTLPFFHGKPEITMEGKSPEGVDFKLTYTFQGIRGGILWFNEDIFIKGKKVAHDNAVGVPLSMKPVRVAAVGFTDVTLPTLYVAVVDNKPAPDVAIVALGTKSEKSKT